MSNARTLVINPERISGTVALFYYGRSGSFLLGSMLDGHDRVLMVPPHAISFFFETLASSLGLNLSLDRLSNLVCEGVPNLFTDTQTESEFYSRGENKNLPIGVNRQSFETALMECLSHDAGNTGTLNIYTIFRAVHIAYAIASNKRISDSGPIWIVWQAHSPRGDRKNMIQSAIPNVHYLTIVRYPEKTADSHIQHWFVDRPMLNPEASLSKSFPHVFVNDQPVNDTDLAPRGAAVRFEDLHNRTEEVMRYIADWLGLDWQAILLQSTIDSELLWFSSHGKPLNGTNKVTSERMKSTFLSPVDRLKLRHVMRETYSEWGYKFSWQFRLPAFVIEKLLWWIPSRVFFKSAQFHLKNCWKADREFHNEMMKERQARNTKPPTLLEVKVLDDLSK